MKKLSLFFILILLVSLPVTGCARKVTGATANPTLVVNVTFAGAVDYSNYRYFLILNRDPANATGPNLITDGKNVGYYLPYDNATPTGLGALDASNTPNFKYTDFYEYSLSRGGATHGTVANSFNSAADPSISIVNNGTSITFSIPLDPLVPFYQIQIVSTYGTGVNNYIVTDFLASGYNSTGYQSINNVRGYFYPTTAVGPGPGPAPPAAADITNFSISII